MKNETEQVIQSLKRLEKTWKIVMAVGISAVIITLFPVLYNTYQLLVNFNSKTLLLFVVDVVCFVICVFCFRKDKKMLKETQEKLSTAEKLKEEASKESKK